MRSLSLSRGPRIGGGIWVAYEYSYKDKDLCKVLFSSSVLCVSDSLDQKAPERVANEGVERTANSTVENHFTNQRGRDARELANVAGWLARRLTVSAQVALHLHVMQCKCRSVLVLLD